MKFSLIIPCYNEAKNLPLLLKRCDQVFDKDKIEVILVDNGSTDNTDEYLNNNIHNYPGCRWIRVENNKGYGHGIISGLAAAKGQILGWTHADMQTDPADITKGIEIFEKNDIDIFCKGKRFGRPFADVFFTFGMSIFESLLMKNFMWDINAQPTMFSKDFFNSWEEPPQDFSLDLYAYFMAKKNGMKIFRFPVFFGKRAYGISHWNINWKSKLNFIKRTLSYSIKLRNSFKR